MMAANLECDDDLPIWELWKDACSEQDDAIQIENSYEDWVNYDDERESWLIPQTHAFVSDELGFEPLPPTQSLMFEEDTHQLSQFLFDDSDVVEPINLDLDHMRTQIEQDSFVVPDLFGDSSGFTKPVGVHDYVCIRPLPAGFQAKRNATRSREKSSAEAKRMKRILRRKKDPIIPIFMIPKQKKSAKKKKTDASLAKANAKL